jgi:hypothetical protein
MGHVRELITVDVYGDNTNIIPEEMPELISYMEEVMPKKSVRHVDSEMKGEEVLDTLVDMGGLLPRSDFK